MRMRRSSKGCRDGCIANILNPFKSVRSSNYYSCDHLLQLAVEQVEVLALPQALFEAQVPFFIPLERRREGSPGVLVFAGIQPLFEMARLVLFDKGRNAGQFECFEVLLFRILVSAFWRSGVHAELAIGDVLEGLCGRTGRGVLRVHVVVSRVLLVLFSGGGTTAIAFLAEGEIEVVAAEANPVALPGHGCENEAVERVFGRR